MVRVIGLSASGWEVGGLDDAELEQKASHEIRDQVHSSKVQYNIVQLKTV